MILYKYLTVEKATEWLVGENSILLTPPIYLNDLLEFRVRRESADLQERRALFEECQRERPSRVSFEEFDREITKIEFLADEPDDMRRNLSKLFGVVSLTEDPVDELMWAHYGLNTGVAIGYRSPDVIELDGMKCRSLPLGLAFKVKYSNDVASIKKDFSDASRHLTTKRTCWAYEKEWRILNYLQEAKMMSRGSECRYVLPAQREQIAHVVFGANAEPEFIKRVDDWLQDSPAVRQKLRIDPSSHDLVLTEIE